MDDLTMHGMAWCRNILVGDGDRLKVGDFGLSKLVEVKFLHDMYRLTGETGSCECLCCASCPATCPALLYSHPCVTD